MKKGDTVRMSEILKKGLIEMDCKDHVDEFGDKIVYLPAITKLNIPGRVFCEQSKFYKESENHIDTAWKI